MRRLSLFLFSALFSVEAASFELISDAEAIASQSVKAYEALGEEVPTQAPVIEVSQPGLPMDRAVRNPLNIEVSFVPHQGASIDFSSFKAYYGNLKLDITDRLLRHLIKTSNGFKLQNVALPKGSHKIVLAIRDDKAREGRRAISLIVE